jgi:hypothetical protein
MVMHLSVSSQSFKFGAIRQILLLLVLLVYALAVFADTSDNASGENTGEVFKAKQLYSFPAWPERPHYKREIVPPAPPGPYMSTALSDYTFKRVPFDDELQYEQAPPVNHSNSINSTMDTFSPDVPWPDERPGEAQRSNRWVPENGYQYVDPVSGNVGVQQNAYGYDDRGWRGQNSQNRGMNVNAPRWMPSMGNGAGYYGPYGGSRPGQFYSQSRNQPPSQ